MSRSLTRTRPRAPRGPFQSVAAWRAAHTLNQREAAKVLGVSQAYYSRLERGLRRPVEDDLKRIAITTSVPIEVLVGLAS